MRAVDHLKSHVPRPLKARVAFYGLRLALLSAALSDRLHRPQGALPVPPARLRYRVHGAVDRRSFLDLGWQTARDVTAAVESAGRSLASLHAILDFGCGCGRTL